MQINSIKELMLDQLLLKRLNRLKNPPKQLLYIGADPTELLRKPSVAIVGTRKMSAYGKTVTEKIATELARAGVVIISGNALGVDVTTQKAALEAGGKVIAVVPSGLDKVYPATNTKVVEKIVAQGGSIISEYEAGHMPRPEEFLARNRIIAGLSDAVIVTEAAQRSGSLNTALHAKNADIPIFAVPGPITSAQSTGSNQLIRDGAHILTEPNDILQFLGLQNQDKKLSLTGANSAETQLLRAIYDGVQDTTALSETLHMPVSNLLEALTVLEIDGRVKQDTLGRWSICS